MLGICQSTLQGSNLSIYANPKLNAQAGTKSKALELCLLYVEVEEDQGEGVMVRWTPHAPCIRTLTDLSCLLHPQEDVIVGLAAKQPKIVAGSVSVLREIVRFALLHLIHSLDLCC